MTRHAFTSQVADGANAALLRPGYWNEPHIDDATISVTDQTVNASTTALIAGSIIEIPTRKLSVGSAMRWTLGLSKTNAGTVASTFYVQLGTTETTSDTDVLTFLLPVAGTGVVDTARVDILAICRGPVLSTAIFQGMFTMTHNLATTGFINIAAVNLKATSSAFDATTPGLFGSLVLKTAALQVWTIQSVVSELLNC